MKSGTANLASAWDPHYRMPHFPYAVYFNDEEDRLVRVYRPRDKHPSSAESYDPAKHEGKLSCPDCSAALHFNSGQDEKGGDARFKQAAHFKTNADSSHMESCQYKAEPREVREYNDAIGYRVHLNLKKFTVPENFSNVFNRSASIYFKGEFGRPTLKAEYKYLEDRRSFDLHTPNNFLTLLRRGDFPRLKDSVFINHDLIMTEKEFVIRYSRKPGELEKRFTALYERLASMPKRQSLPSLMEFKLDKGREDMESNSHHSVLSKKIFFYQEKTEAGYGRKHYIVPRALPTPCMRQELEESFSEKGGYLVLGYTSLGETIESEGAIIHYMDIHIVDKDQVLRADLDQILARTLEKHGRVQKGFDEPKVA